VLTRSRRQFEIRILFALVLVGAISFYDIHTMRGTTFYSDEWPGLAAYSWSPHILLRPQGGHNFAFSSIMWNSVAAIFGDRSYLPFRLLGLACNLFTAVAVFTYGWKRLSYGAGLLLALVTLTMGSSFQTVLWPSAALGIVSVGVLVFSLLILDNMSRWGSIAIVLMLVAMIGVGGYGLLALFGVIVEIVLRRRWHQLWIPAIPTALYLIWRVAYHAGLTTAGAAGTGHVPLLNYTGAPSYIVQQLTATMAGLTGQVVTLGAALTVGFVAIVAWLWRGGRIDAIRIATLTAVPLFFWFLLAIVRGQNNEFGAPRYVAFGALPIALILVEALRSRRGSLKLNLAAITLVCFCALANFSQLEVAGGDFRYLGMLDLPTQTALQMAANYVPPSFAPSPTLASSLVAGPYLESVRRLGSNAPSPAQLQSQPEAGRAMADIVLLGAGAIRFAEGSAEIQCGAPSSGEIVPISAGDSLTVHVITGTTSIFARRFADENPNQPLKTLSSPAIVVAVTRPDAKNFSSPKPWTFSISGGSFQICS
jgi:hypothetical protein